MIGKGDWFLTFHDGNDHYDKSCYCQYDHDDDETGGDDGDADDGTATTDRVNIKNIVY